MVAIVPFTPEWSPAVCEFNRRLVEGGLDAALVFPETPRAEFGTDPAERVWQEFFLATEDGQVRGGYFLTHEPWWHRGGDIETANYRLPLSEGLVDPKYRGLGLVLLRHALQRQPLLYAMGMGGYDRPLPRMLQTLKWPIFTTPFFFRARRPGRMLRNLQSMRRSALRRVAFDVAAFSGAAWVGVRTLQRIRTKTGVGARVRVDRIESFDDWADSVWDRYREGYSLLANRTVPVLRLRYPAADTRFIRLRLEIGGVIAGWSVLLDTLMRGDKHFGDLRVGTIVDCFGDPAHASAVVRASAAELDDCGVDLVISNQSHEAWCHAFRTSGFLEGPSNRLFACSPALAQQLKTPFEEARPRMHFTRGDGSGPIHL